MIPWNDASCSYITSMTGDIWKSGDGCMKTKGSEGDVYFEQQHPITSDESYTSMIETGHHANARNDLYHIAGWTVGVLLGIVVAIILLSGAAPTLTVGSMMIPALLACVFTGMVVFR
jgi:hypothetical protein